ncbi:MAG: DUF565 domain-containing protein, partial [Synechococcus sp. SB0667_bin_8]|nr:DUF565 domain-containing protein [Synechococcus sp. SB0667_bin_8]
RQPRPSWTLSPQHTRLQSASAGVGRWLLDLLLAPWRRRVVLVLGLTGGFFLGQLGIPLLTQLSPFGDSDLGALLVLVAAEVLVRLRGLGAATPSLLQHAVDNIRIGFVFSVVLEAFKLGS